MIFLKIWLKQIAFWDRFFTSIFRLIGKADRGSDPQTAQSDKALTLDLVRRMSARQGMITTSDMTRCAPWQKALLALVLMPLAAVRMAAKRNKSAAFKLFRPAGAYLSVSCRLIRTWDSASQQGKGCNGAMGRVAGA